MQLKAHHDGPAWDQYRGQRSSKRKELLAFMREHLVSKNDSIEIDLHYEYAYRAARDLGIKITIRKLNGNGYRIWKVA